MSRYRNILIITLGILFIVASFTVFSCKKPEDVHEDMAMTERQETAEKEILYYTCGMHPTVRVKPEDYEAGNNKCPICNMNLVPVYREDEATMDMTAAEHGEHEQLAVEAQLKLDARAQTLAQVKTESIEFRYLMKEISTVGQMDYDERKVAYVAAWIPGRIDKLFVDFTGDRVEKGDPLIQIYSPNLLTTQEEYLLALETLDRVKESPDPQTIEGAKSLVESARQRLLLWGISEKQIKELDSTRKASTSMIIPAPSGGTVIQKNAFEGKYVKEGENLFQIADLSRLWMQADIYENDLALIEVGQTVIIHTEAYSDDVFKGNIVFLDPFVNPKTRTVKIRVDVPNPGFRLKPGMYVDVYINVHIHEGIKTADKVVYTCPMHPEVLAEEHGDCPICGMKLVQKEQAPEGTVLAIPKSAVLDTGARKVVYVEKEVGVYVPREVEIGPEAIGMVNRQKKRFYSVLAGLTEGMKVVTQANFLIDSQSQITGQAEAVYSGALERGEEKKPPSKHIH
jgi:multidrug efflux pump subunit AcrA (membrane-fusion protein)